MTYVKLFGISVSLIAFVFLYIGLLVFTFDGLKGCADFANSIRNSMGVNSIVGLLIITIIITILLKWVSK